MSPDEEITRERWLIERLLIQCAEQGEPINLALAREAVVSTALSQGWDLDETRTRTEWEAES